MNYPGNSISDNNRSFKDLRVAIIHYWLLGFAGGERVVSSFIELFPHADLFVLVADQKTVARFGSNKVTTSFLQRVPGSQRYHRHLLPFYPLALEQFDLRGYDLVISSESGPAKGVITSTHTLHINYCHSPMRYIWDMYHDYVNGEDMKGLQRSIFALVSHYMRAWDLASASRVDAFIANSKNTAARIRKHYRRDSTVIYPPVNTEFGYLAEPGDYYLTVGRLVDYKRIDLAIGACTRLGRPLRVVGTGPQLNRLREISGPTVTFLGELSEQQLHRQYAHCRALVFPGEEDFGIVPVEASSFGRPVIAFGRGGALETIQGQFAEQSSGIDDSASGIFFAQQTVECLSDAILTFEAAEHNFSPVAIKRGTAHFSNERLKREIADFVTARLDRSKNFAEIEPILS